MFGTYSNIWQHFSGGVPGVTSYYAGQCTSGKGLPHVIWNLFDEPVKVIKLTFQSRPDYIHADLPSKLDAFGSNNADCKNVS